MHRFAKLLIYTLVLLPVKARAEAELTDIIDALRSDERFAAEVTYSATPAHAEGDIRYHISLFSTPARGDSLLDFNYLTQWSRVSDRKSGASNDGFAAYFNGNHFRFLDDRLKEYHYADDRIPFIVAPSIQNASMFIDLYPASIAEELKEMSTDPRSHLTMMEVTSSNGTATICFTAKYKVNGELVRTKEFKFSLPQVLPLEIITVNNPDTDRESSSRAVYSYPTPAPADVEISEAYLAKLFPEAFAEKRLSNMTAEGLVGSPLPSFSLPTATGERYTRERGERFASPTALLIFDPSEAGSAELVSELRHTLEGRSTPLSLIFVSISSNIDNSEQAVPELREGEHLLISGSSLARKCGVSHLPTLLVADREGIVKKVVAPLNREQCLIVLNSMTDPD